VAIYPKDFIEENLKQLPDADLKKVLQTNSAKLYKMAV
jgi:hypothetical protein